MPGGHAKLGAQGANYALQIRSLMAMARSPNLKDSGLVRISRGRLSKSQREPYRALCLELRRHPRSAADCGIAEVLNALYVRTAICGSK